jgi:hypothetical protein
LDRFGRDGVARTCIPTCLSAGRAYGGSIRTAFFLGNHGFGAWSDGAVEQLSQYRRRLGAERVFHRPGAGCKRAERCCARRRAGGGGTGQLTRRRGNLAAVNPDRGAERPSCHHPYDELGQLGVFEQRRELERSALGERFRHHYDGCDHDGGLVTPGSLRAVRP